MTIAIDFDACIAKYDKWKGKKGIFGDPVPGIKEALVRFKEHSDIIIVNTTRLEIHQVKEYMDEHGLLYDYINYNPENIIQMLHPAKVLADVYIDDRGIQFNGIWDDYFIESVINFKPYWKKRGNKW